MRCHCLKCVHNIDGFCECSSYIEIDKNGECDSIKKIPAADVATVRHGRWICKYDPKYGVTYITCSRCRDIRSIDGCYEGTNGESLFDQENYCHNCGAKMDGD